MTTIRHPNRSVPLANSAARRFSRTGFLRALQERADRRRAIREQEAALFEEAWEQLDSYDETLWAGWDAGLNRAHQRRDKEIHDA